MKIDVQDSFPMVYDLRHGELDSLVWDYRAALLQASFSPQWKNVLEFSHRTVIIQESAPKPLDTSYTIEVETCSIWVPPQRRTMSHALSTWMCEGDNSSMELFVLWQEGNIGLSSHLLSLASSSLTSHLVELGEVAQEIELDLDFFVHKWYGLSLRCQDLANPEGLVSMIPVTFGKRMRYKMKKPALDPQTKHDCLYMCLSFELARLGVKADPALLRNRMAKIWTSGWTYCGGSAADWAAAAGVEQDIFIKDTRRRRWGTAADAVGLAKSFDKSIRIFDGKSALIVAECLPHQRGCINLLLHNKHYVALDPSQVEDATGLPLSCYLFRQPGARHRFMKLIDLPAYLEHLRCPSLSRSPAHCPAAETDQDPMRSGGEEDLKNSQTMGSEDKSRKDPEGHQEEGLTQGVWVGVFSDSFCDWILDIDVFVLPFFVNELFLRPGRSKLGRLSSVLGHAGGASVKMESAHISYEGGMPTKQLPSKLAPSRQCEDWSDDEALDLTGMWIALKRNNFRVAASLASPIEASLPPGSMVRVIGPTMLVGDIVRAFVELAAPSRKGTIADMGFITLRALRPEGPVFYRPARANDRIFLRDVVPLGLNTMGTKRLVWKWQFEAGGTLPDEQAIDSSLDSSTPGTPPPPPTSVWRWSLTEPENEVPGIEPGEEMLATDIGEGQCRFHSPSSSSSSSLSSADLFDVTHRPETQEFLFNSPGHTQQLYGLEFQIEICSLPGASDMEPLPLIWWFCGLNDKNFVRYAYLKEHAVQHGFPGSSFIVATILQPPGHWWFLDDKKDYGWLVGDLDVPLLHKVVSLMEAVSLHPQVHPRLVFLSGFSAGAYAITELLAVGIPFPVASIVFGGVHGHGNALEVCNSLALSNVVRERTPEFDGKWRAYLSRLSQPSEDDIRSIVVVHNKRDLMSPWVAAEPIIHAIDQSRTWNDLPLVRQVVFIQEKSNKNKNAHQYWRRVRDS
eukprot:2221724-Amphidinium_carterae.1